MTKTALNAKQSRPQAATQKAQAEPRVHPVIIYPFQPAAGYTDLESLYELVARLDADKQRYARPITVMDRKTYYALEQDQTFLAFRKNTVARHSQILDVWAVDTCQMWYSGLGCALEQGQPNDVYWLIPGDFNYGAPAGLEVLSHLHDLPEIILELDQDVCIGEIETDKNNSKHLIDTYGTFSLLYNWFPAETQEIRGLTERPRSEFFAVRHGFLRETLNRRWYAYEQTVVMLIQAAIAGKRISRFFVGRISDLPEGRESLASAVQQIDRTERVLKALWRERHQPEAGWIDQYRLLETQSEQIRRAATTILQALLK